MLQKSRQKGLKKDRLVITVYMNIRKLGINILGPNIHVHVISMDWVLYKLLTAHTAHEILWTMPWTPWIVMREQPAFRAVLPGASARQVWRSVVKLLFCRQNFCAVVKFGAHSVVKLSFRLVNILLCRHNLKQNKIVGLWTFKSIALNPGRRIGCLAWKGIRNTATGSPIAPRGTTTLPV